MNRLAYRVYSYALISSLPFKFFASELFMWNREQLAWVAKTHRAVMLAFAIAVSWMIGNALHAQYGNWRETQNSERIATAQNEIARQDVRIDRLQTQVNNMNIQMTQVSSDLKSMSENLRVGMTILGAISLAILGQFLSYVFNIKMRREYERIERRGE